MNECSFGFGPQGRLSGTLTLPPDGQAPRLGVVLLNVGIIHRIGPHRFNAKLARALAREGLAAFRLDLSSQGDSGAPDESVPFEQQAVADLQAAMDQFQRMCPVQQFVIAGICSGAYSGLATALADRRVVGLWMLDGYAYPTARSRWNRYVHPWRDLPSRTLKSWARKLTGRAARAVRRAVSHSPTDDVWDFGRPAPAREVFGRDVQTLVDRGVALCFAYSGSMRWYFNYPDQLREAFSEFGFVDRVRCEYLPQADHTATTLATQQRLIHSVSDWLHAAFAGGRRFVTASPTPSRGSPRPPG